jgi:hypothetical protein
VVEELVSFPVRCGDDAIPLDGLLGIDDYSTMPAELV